jgi:serine/threonine protein kinase
MSPHGTPIVYPADLVIPYEQLKFGRAIGSGGTATVYRGQYRGQLVAIKSFKCEMLTREYVARFAQEMAFAATLHDRKYELV